MSSPFPQLLRRANLATYDPLITRIYTSTPSSKSQHGDWGLKFPVNLPKGPRYIKFSSLDAGPGFNCDWRSAEREARFMSAWGDGSVRWKNDDEVLKYAIKTRGIYTEDSLVEEEGEGKEIWMKDVESMSEEDFEIYLERIRSERKRFLSQSLESMAESNRESLKLPEDKTLVNLATGGLVGHGSTASFQAQLTSEDLFESNPNSTKINSRPHRVHGLTYVSPPHTSSDYTRITEKKGRALNKVNRSDDAYSRAQDANTGGLGKSIFGRNNNSNNNLPWVVGLGGLTAKSRNAQNRIYDQSSSTTSTTLEETDYTRIDRERGVGNFRVTKAQVDKPPTVLALKESRAGGQFSGKWRQSGASLPSAMDTFKFDIDVTLASTSTSSTSTNDGQGQVEVGSREWVARDKKLNSIEEFTRDMGLKLQLGGEPRKDRIKGEAAERLRKLKVAEESEKRVERMLQRIKDRRLGFQDKEQK